MAELTATWAQPEPGSRERATIPRDWLEEFDAAARRPLATRFRYAFIRTYKPILDDVPYRSFETTAEYRAWCDANLPEYLGYRIANLRDIIASERASGPQMDLRDLPFMAAFRDEYERQRAPPLRPASAVAEERSRTTERL